MSSCGADAQNYHLSFVRYPASLERCYSVDTTRQLTCFPNSFQQFQVKAFCAQFGIKKERFELLCLGPSDNNVRQLILVFTGPQLMHTSSPNIAPIARELSKYWVNFGGYIMGTVRKTITLTDMQDTWIKAQIDAGHDTNHSEYIRDLIRHEQERSAGTEAIRTALIEGEASGKPRPVDVGTFKQRMLASHN